MAQLKMTVEEVASVVDREGLGYALTNYMNADSIADSMLAQAWTQAQQAMARVKDLLDTLDDEGACDDQGDLALEGMVTVRHSELLVDGRPSMFDQAPANEHGLPELTFADGGRVSYLADSSRGYVFVEGAFTAQDLTAVLRELAPHVSAHIVQLVRLAGADYPVIRFEGGQASFRGGVL